MLRATRPSSGVKTPKAGRRAGSMGPSSKGTVLFTQTPQQCDRLPPQGLLLIKLFVI